MATSTIKETIDNLLIMNLCYQYGYLDTIPDDEKAMYWAEIAASLGVSEAMTDLGIHYMIFENDWNKALSFFNMAIELNEPSAYYMLGYCYKNAFYVKQDLEKGFENYKKASELGYASADYQLGMLYYLGKGVPKNVNTALQYFIKAAENGDSDAQ